MTALIISTLLASLLGSLHCAGMCGAFLAIAVSPAGGGTAAPVSRAKVQAAYHTGRLITYTLLGVAAGTAGALVNLSSTLVGIQPVAASLAGAVMIWFGVSMLLRVAGVRLPRVPLPGAMQRLLMRGHASAMALPPLFRAGAIGLLTTLLPCGWLYTFAVIAAGTAHPATGAVVMAVFWVGTLPVLVALGTGLQRGLGAFGKRLPVITGLLVVVVGIHTLVGRSLLDVRLLTDALAQRPAAASSATPSKPPCCTEMEKS